MINFWRLTVLFATALLVASCGIFGDKDEELQPKELVKIDNTLAIKRLWSTKVGGDSDKMLVGLRPVGDGSRIYAASQDGKVIAVDPVSGKLAWKIDLKIELSSGPSARDGAVAVVSKDGQVILLDATTGAESWRTSVGGESLAEPLILKDSVVVQTIDSRLVALARFDGRSRWELEQMMPLLTMRGSSSPVLVGSSIVAGFDNGRLLAVNVDTGDIVWDTLLSIATGRSDLDRLSDIDGAIAVVGQDVYAAGYHGRLSSVAAESGQILWSREISSYAGVAADWNSVYTTREDGEIIAMSRSTGVETWRNDDLLRREPTLPIPFHTTVVVGDLEGYLHFFSSIDGKPVARLKQGGKAISIDPLVVANKLYVQSDDGNLVAYEVKQDAPQRRAPDISETADES